MDKVDFLVDGTVVDTDTTPPYTFSWDSTAVSDGTHAVTARAVDTAGQSATSSPASVTVNNAGPGAEREHLEVDAVMNGRDIVKPGVAIGIGDRDER